MRRVRLSRIGSQVLQPQGQQLAIRGTRGQVDPDAPAGLPYAGPDLQELESQGVHLGGGQRGALEMVTQQPRQAISRGVEEQPELIGQEGQLRQSALSSSFSSSIRFSTVDGSPHEDWNKARWASTRL